MLDQLSVERRRGITIKAHTATMFHSFGGEVYMLNLIDTPVSARLGVVWSVWCSSPFDTFTRPLVMLLSCLLHKGHVDFSYEVSRSLSACQGALLVVDGQQVRV